MANTLHIYGDSYSTGYGLTPRISKIPAGYAQYKNYTWNENIANHIPNIEVKNNAVPGCSNEIIQFLFLRDISSFTKGDTIIVGLSDYSRISTILEYKDRSVKQYLHLSGRAYMMYAQNLTSDNPTQNFIPYYLKETFQKNNFPASMFSSGMEFLHDYYLNDKIRDNRREYYKDCFLSLVELLDKLEINLYVWDSTIWGYGENIMTWSNFAYNDSHWSPNGNNFFLGYLLWGINNNFRYLDLELFKQHESEIFTFIEHKKLNKYIEHSLVAI